MTGLISGLIEKGNIDLNNRPVVPRDDGTYSTVDSMGFTDDSGAQVVIPTVTEDGALMYQDTAIRHYLNTGKHLGKYKTVKQADRAAIKLHNDQDKQYRARFLNP